MHASSPSVARSTMKSFTPHLQRQPRLQGLVSTVLVDSPHGDHSLAVCWAGPFQATGPSTGRRRPTATPPATTRRSAPAKARYCGSGTTRARSGQACIASVDVSSINFTPRAELRGEIFTSRHFRLWFAVTRAADPAVRAARHHFAQPPAVPPPRGPSVPTPTARWRRRRR